jgi:hypothetical protein
MAVQTSEHITTRAKTGCDGVRVALSAEELEQAGIHPGEDVLLEIRRYTSEDWIRDNEARVYYSEEEFDTAMEELAALPQG